MGQPMMEELVLMILIFFPLCDNFCVTIFLVLAQTDDINTVNPT